jgi:hypothetical protein
MDTTTTAIQSCSSSLATHALLSSLSSKTAATRLLVRYDQYLSRAIERRQEHAYKIIVTRRRLLTVRSEVDAQVSPFYHYIMDTTTIHARCISLARHDLTIIHPSDNHPSKETANTVLRKERDYRIDSSSCHFFVCFFIESSSYYEYLPLSFPVLLRCFPVSYHIREFLLVGVSFGSIVLFGILLVSEKLGVHAFGTDKARPLGLFDAVGVCLLGVVVGTCVL